MNDDEQYDSQDGGMVIAVIMLTAIFCTVLGCLLTLGVQWALRAWGN